ncbi:MAG TPA: type VI secretion system ATPase TssH, partial [Gammaproteobacteria bacterium]|nr:type VI secretion system ATPase TssH [Gammaproteobacteria bacterium]
YVGYEQGGYLTEAVRRRPYTVLLLDEVEKAHPDVFNILLQVMDDGRLTDSHGRTVDFRNTVIVMTSNLGSDRIQEMMIEKNFASTDYEDVKKAVLNSVVKHFSPEFVNRIDESVVFHPLQKNQIRGIAEIQIRLLNGRLLNNDLSLQVSTEVLDRIAEIGYDPVYGARPLKRAIQNWIENPLAQQVLQGDYVAGDVIAIDINIGGEFEFKKLSREISPEVV